MESFESVNVDSEFCFLFFVFFFVQRSRQDEKHLPLDLKFFLWKKLTESCKIVESILSAPFYGKLQ